MKKWALLLLVCGAFCTQLDAQEKVTGTYDSLPLEDVLRDISRQSNVRVYFREAALDSLLYTGSFEEYDPSRMLEEILDVFGLHAFMYEGAYYVTLREIISSPPISQALKRKGFKSTVVQKGILFSQEYRPNAATEEDIEKRIFEIGDKSRLVPGGKSTIAGHIKAAESSDPLIGAVVYTEDAKYATSTDMDGFYSIQLPNGRVKLLFQYAGMSPTQRNIVLFANGKLDVSLEDEVVSLDEVIVTSERDRNVRNVEMGISRLEVEEAKNVPKVLGENDILKVATTYAGVQTVGEGASGFNVRGGKSDQNLMLLNGATIYNSSHFFGFFSVFNADAIQSMDIYKSSMPARYGGRLSSVFDIRSKSANREKVKGYGGISPIAARLALEVPLFNKKAGLMIAGRTTYSNWVLNNVGNASFRNNRVSFGDLIMRLDQDLGKKNKLSVNAYYGKDKFRLNSDTLFTFSGFQFVNANASVQFFRQFTDDLTGSIQFTQSTYDYELSFDESPPNAFVQDFGIEESTLNLDMAYYKDDVHTLRMGAEVKNYRINPGSKKPKSGESLVLTQIIQEEQALQSAVYVSDEYSISEKLSMYGGLRYSLFSTYGEQEVALYEPNAPINSDSRTGYTSFEDGEWVKTYQGPELRASLRYQLTQNSSIKAAYNKTRQYLHTLSNSAALSPTDTWRMSNEYIKPQISDQYSIGYYQNFSNNRWETSLEGYYKKLQNLLDFKVNSQFLLNPNIETVVLQGPGKSYGLEFSVNKKGGKFTGWLNYTYSRTFLKLDGEFPEEVINQGSYYPAGHDIPHTVNLVSNYKLTHRLSLSYNFNFKSGRPVTYPVGVYEYQGIEIAHYTDRNKFRIPYYMRMDLGVNLEVGHRLDKVAYSYWSFSVYNLLGRENPYSVFFDVQDGEVNGYQLIVFGSPIPTISYNFNF